MRSGRQPLHPVAHIVFFQKRVELFFKRALAVACVSIKTGKLPLLARGTVLCSNQREAQTNNRQRLKDSILHRMFLSHFHDDCTPFTSSSLCERLSAYDELMPFCGFLVTADSIRLLTAGQAPLWPRRTGLSAASSVQE